MKKTLVLLLIAALCVGLLAGCEYRYSVCHSH